MTAPRATLLERCLEYIRDNRSVFVDECPERNECTGCGRDPYKEPCKPDCPTAALIAELEAAIRFETEKHGEMRAFLEGGLNYD